MLEIRTSRTGRGVFATQRIATGNQLIQFTGPLLRYDQTTPQTLALQIGPDLYLGGSGGPDDCVNHSCHPNAGLIIRDQDVNLIAIRDIEADEQITFDYSTTMDEDDFEMPCLCGHAECRKLIRDFKYLPRQLQELYAGLGIVPQYNLKYLK